MVARVSTVPRDTVVDVLCLLMRAYINFGNMIQVLRSHPYYRLLKVHTPNLYLSHGTSSDTPGINAPAVIR